MTAHTPPFSGKSHRGVAFFLAQNPAERRVHSNRLAAAMAKPKRSVLSAVQSSTSPPDELSETQSLARVAKALGNNNFACELPDGKPIVVELQPQFRNTVFIRRGGYVLVDLASAENRSKNSKVVGEIINVVLDEREWRKQPYW